MVLRLVDDPGRIGCPTAVRLDETLFVREGPRRRQRWSTSIVDVRAGVLLDVVSGPDSAGLGRWLAARPEASRATIAWATLDLSGPYRWVFDTMLPDAIQVADPFRLLPPPRSHPGRKHDPLHRCRRLFTKADEPLDDQGRS